ncbi:hypothetical protein [Mariprofundus ferrooxydans]|uniref:hypothetical protein n=1 Tax=Mariprofundus ferrooxydans TaxID=314344 RepID=UPI00035E152B|nr:hypothetical protein [Mariprofundus ferrooxydans]
MSLIAINKDTTWFAYIAKVALPSLCLVAALGWLVGEVVFLAAAYIEVASSDNQKNLTIAIFIAIGGIAWLMKSINDIVILKKLKNTVSK